MEKIAIVHLIKMLVKLADAELMKSFFGNTLDFFEAKVLGSESTLDDDLFLPIIDSCRRAFSLTTGTVEPTKE